MIDRWLDRVAARHVTACALLVCLGLLAVLPGFTTLFPMDRDEPRFAQASKQMLESGDFGTIRFHDEARNKKPVGIYWLQAAAVEAGTALGVDDAHRVIWLYRIPSLLGALAAVLLTYWAALPLTTRRGALTAGGLMATTLLLVVEAHLAKTDAVLLATVVAAMGVLARAFVARARRQPLTLGQCAVFWGAVAVGILIKGPITPMVPLFASLVLAARERSFRWLGALRPVPGLIACLIVVAPWFIFIIKATGGAFLAESVGHDMAAKVASGQESHGAPFGTYAVAFWLTAWPFAPFVLLAAPVAWRDRRSDQVAFLLAWLVPTWLLFETVPTKLPHYVLPTYPALAILAAASLQKMQFGHPIGRIRLWLFGLALALVPALMPVLLALAPGRIASSVGLPTMLLAGAAMTLAAGCIAVSIQSVRQQRWGVALTSAAVAGLGVYGFVLGWMLNSHNADLLALSPRLAAAGRAAAPACADPRFATVGDQEPSLVFLTGTDILFADANSAAQFLEGGPCRVTLVVSREEPSFQAALKALRPGAPVPAAVSHVDGININGGKRLDFGVYAGHETAP